MNQEAKRSLAVIPFLMLILAALACAQDCMGTTFSVKGYVVDEQHNPIPNATIRAWNNGSFERAAFEFRTTSNDAGYFDTNSTFSYGCTSFQVEVSAEGFESRTLKFYPPAGEGWPDELPDEVTIQLRALSD